MIITVGLAVAILDDDMWNNSRSLHPDVGKSLVVVVVSAVELSIGRSITRHGSFRLTARQSIGGVIVIPILLRQLG